MGVNDGKGNKKSGERRIDCVHPWSFARKALAKTNDLGNPKVSFLLPEVVCFAEREGFEPPDPRRSTVFKTAAIDRSAISP